MTGLTLYDKLWDSHFIGERSDGMPLLYIDRHLLHEVTSPQAFEGLRIAGRSPWRVDNLIATPDHNIPTVNQGAGIAGIADPISRLQVETLDSNCQRYGIKEFGMNHPNAGIVHVIGPELGATLPGMTVVCGDSHTSTHGAFAALAFGIGTSEVEHALATQCLPNKRMKNMRVFVTGNLNSDISSKDLILFIISTIGIAGGTGFAIEYAGSAISGLSMEARMTLCNMTIEAGSRFGLVGYDLTTENYLKGKRYAPRSEQWDKAVDSWKSLVSDRDAVFDFEIEIEASNINPQVSWGTTPAMVCDVTGRVPDPKAQQNKNLRNSFSRALDYMGLHANQLISSIKIDRVFIGSCTNGRIEDLRAAAKIAKNGKVSASIKQAMVVPGSRQVKAEAEAEGLHEVFKSAGFEWRDPGCSMCLAMNADKLQPGEHCASTSNRNFEGRQGSGGRTHLVSPATAAAAALTGNFVDFRTVR